MKIVVNPVVIRDNKLLLVKKRVTWIPPGGKREGPELELDCLSREIWEELPGTRLENLRFYRTFNGLTPHSKQPVQAITYLADIRGELGKPSSEILDAQWIRDFDQYNLSEPTYQMVRSLKNDGYL